ncbi:MAG: hypothetical protein NT096_10685 [Proteobacteria bacterium]|nr:hypothetical protein [Pseudomonadota bacterium]
MAKYLGSLGKWDFFVATAFGEYRDTEAVRQIQRERYKLICNGKIKKNGEKEPVDIFCTAITLDHHTHREINLFDDLDTTYHIFSVGNKYGASHHIENIGSVCSFALECQESRGGGGVKIGLPLENKVNNEYPQGCDLDPFRERYEYGGRKSRPEERVELYRHFKASDHFGDRVALVGLYKSGFFELIAERKRKGRTPVTKWLFCSKPSYYQFIYRPVGAMLIPLLLNNRGHDEASPPLKKIEVLKNNQTEKDSGGLFSQSLLVSYRHPINISKNPNEPKVTRWFDYLPLIVDVDRTSDIIQQDKNFSRYPQLNRISHRIIVEDLFNEHHDNPTDKAGNINAKELMGALPTSGWGEE